MGFLSDFSKYRALKTRDKLLDLVVTIHRSAVSKSASGGQVETWQVVGTCAGRLRRTRRMLYIDRIAGQVQPEASWDVLVAPEIQILPLDRLGVGGGMFSVIGTDSGRSDALVQVVSCERIGA